MEDVYPRVAHTDTRELYLRDIGRGRVAYIPWDIDRTFWDVLCVDHRRLLRNAIAWARERAAPRRGHRARRARRHGLAAARLDDRPPGEPDEPDDDEGAAARGDPGRAASACASDCRKASGPTRVQLLTAGLTPRVDDQTAC